LQGQDDHFFYKRMKGTEIQVEMTAAKVDHCFYAQKVTYHKTPEISPYPAYLSWRNGIVSKFGAISENKVQ